MCFFFQAEDGIRDVAVTGVQTCALPIYHLHGAAGGLCREGRKDAFRIWTGQYHAQPRAAMGGPRSEERRVGKECRSRGWLYHYKKKRNASSRCVRLYTVTSRRVWAAT